jgi:hypothetical protein
MIDGEPITLLFMPRRSDAWPVALAAAMLAAGAVPSPAQSLAEVARQEEARRKEIKQPAKVYTNKDLVSVPSPSPPPQTAASPSTTPADAAGKDAPKDGAKDPQGKDPKDPGVARDQAYWSARMMALVAQLDRDQIVADALQARIGAMTGDSADRQKATDELERLTRAIQADKKAIADLEEEARRASAPPGWLR